MGEQPNRCDPQAVRYALQASPSRFTVQAFARGALSALGHSPTFAIRSFTGEVSFTGDLQPGSAISLTIRADSLVLTDAVSANDREEIERRMRQEVLETASYPEIVFRSTDISAGTIADAWYRLVIAGTLSLHGTTKAHRLDAQFRLMGDEARLSGEGTLRQSDFRIKRVSALAGMIQLQDELKFSFDLVGSKVSS
jgi:polyisoprenoid-binding protein YceI